MRHNEVVILAAVDWCFSWQPIRILASYLAKNGFRVVYVNGTMITNPHLFNVTSRFKRKFFSKTGRSSDSSLQDVEILRPVVLPPTFKIFRFVNNWVLLKRFFKIVGSLDLKEPIVIWCLPNRTTLDIVSHLNYSLLLYRCTSNFTGLRRAPKDTATIEGELISKSDVLVPDSDYLVRKMRQEGNYDIRQVMPGVDYDLFSQANTGLVKKITRISYFGGVKADTIDIELVLRLAMKLKKCKFQFVGPVNCLLPRMPTNVEFIGRVPHKEVPLYLKDSDCIILPYRINDFTQGVIPTKFFEAFATGKPIIATSLINFVPYKDVISLANDVEDFVEIIENITSYEDNFKYEKRLVLARENTWEIQCRKFLDIIREKLMEQ